MVQYRTFPIVVSSFFSFIFLEIQRKNNIGGKKNFLFIFTFWLISSVDERLEKLLKDLRK
jgi:hypothetical protein